jgi:hypothetical protein
MFPMTILWTFLIFIDITVTMSYLLHRNLTADDTEMQFHLPMGYVTF